MRIGARIFFAAILVFSLGLNAPCYGYEKGMPPFCNPNLALGQSQDQIRDSWGDPDKIEKSGFDEVGIPKETWVYYKKPPLDFMPGHTYVCADFYLTFSGGRLTEYRTKENPGTKNK